MSIHDIPQECFERILGYLEIIDIYALGCTGGLFRKYLTIRDLDASNYRLFKNISNVRILNFTYHRNAKRSYLYLEPCHFAAIERFSADILLPDYRILGCLPEKVGHLSFQISRSSLDTLSNEITQGNLEEIISRLKEIKYSRLHLTLVENLPTSSLNNLKQFSHLRSLRLEKLASPLPLIIPDSVTELEASWCQLVDFPESLEILRVSHGDIQKPLPLSLEILEASYCLIPIDYLSPLKKLREASLVTCLFPEGNRSTEDALKPLAELGTIGPSKGSLPPNLISFKASHLPIPGQLPDSLKILQIMNCQFDGRLPRSLEELIISGDLDEPLTIPKTVTKLKIDSFQMINALPPHLISFEVIYWSQALLPNSLTSLETFNRDVFSWKLLPQNLVSLTITNIQENFSETDVSLPKTLKILELFVNPEREDRLPLFRYGGRLSSLKTNVSIENFLPLEEKNLPMSLFWNRQPNESIYDFSKAISHLPSITSLEVHGRAQVFQNIPLSVTKLIGGFGVCFLDYPKNLRELEIDLSQTDLRRPLVDLPSSLEILKISYSSYLAPLISEPQQKYLQNLLETSPLSMEMVQITNYQGSLSFERVRLKYLNLLNCSLKKLSLSGDLRQIELIETTIEEGSLGYHHLKSRKKDYLLVTTMRYPLFTVRRTEVWIRNDLRKAGKEPSSSL